MADAEYSQLLCLGETDMNKFFDWYMNTLFDYENTPVIVGIMMIGIGVPALAFIAFSPIFFVMGILAVLGAIFG